jgi:transmembrane sensor
MSVPVTRAILRDLSPADAAALWMIQHDSGGPAEAGLFEEWLGTSEANAAAWAALHHAWSAFDDADDPMFAELRREALSAPVAPPRRWRALAAAAAAAAAIVAVAGGAWLMPRGGSRPAQLASRDTVYKTGSEGRTVTLADGSQITLTHDTQVRVGPRQAILDHGRVMFTVRHDAAHPFRVVAGPWSVTDVGTRFEVGLQASGMRVALFEGGVRIEGGSHPAIDLRPGQQFTASGGQPGAVSPVKPVDEAARADGMTEFDAVALAQAVRQFNDANAIELVILDPKIAGLHITGRYRLADPVRFANTIALILPIKVIRAAPDRIELRARR